MVTTSTKVTKPIYNTNLDMKKNDSKQKENVINPNLRKKICVKMSKIMQEKYGLTREAAQALTLKVENRIRAVNSDMGSDYKNKILVVLKLLKVKIMRFCFLIFSSFRRMRLNNMLMIFQRISTH